MTTRFGDSSRIDDLFTAIVTRIEVKDLDGALALYNTIGEESEKRGLLVLINRVIIQNLSLVRELARDINRELARDVDRDLLRSRELERDLAIAIRLELDIALDLQISRDRARSLAHDLALARPHDVAEIILRITSSQRLNQFMIVALSGELTSRLVFDDIETLTLPVLLEDLAPYLQALFDLEKMLVEAKGEEFRQPKIKSIIQNSPVKVEITRVPEALHLLLTVISPFWQQHEKKRARSALAEQKVKLAKEIFGEHATLKQLERAIQIIDALKRKPPTLAEM